MKELIEQIDRMLAGVKPDAGDSVMLLADARKALGTLYKSVLETQKEEQAEKPDGPEEGAKK